MEISGARGKSIWQPVRVAVYYRGCVGEWVFVFARTGLCIHFGRLDDDSDTDFAAGVY